MLLASLAHLQKTLDEFLDVMSLTASTDCDFVGSENNATKSKDPVLSASEKRKRFFDRNELKKVFLLESSFFYDQILNPFIPTSFALILFLNFIKGDRFRGRFSCIS